jgi:hypothetical protein
MRFRLGAHDLRVATGRWESTDNGLLPRQQRLCERCADAQVEDEFHMVFECDAYDVVREKFWRLFADFGGWQNPTGLVRPAGRSLADFMRQRQSSVAAFIHCCFLVRNVTPDMAHLLLPSESLADSADETELSELVEVMD